MKNKKGIALLIAILTLSVVLAVTLTVVNVALKGYQISVSTRDSVYAIYAADSGIDCALYWDIRGYEPPPAGYGGRVFPTSTDSTSPPAGSGITCSGTDMSSIWDTTQQTATAATTTVSLEFGGNCVRLIVAKSQDSVNPDFVDTSILSRGYNVACADIGTSLNTVERAIRATY